MKLLAVETSTEACSAALFIDGDIREKFALAPREHTKLILPMIDDLMSDAEKLQAIRDYYAFMAYGDALIGEAVTAFKANAERRGRPWLRHRTPWVKTRAWTPERPVRGCAGVSARDNRRAPRVSAGNWRFSSSLNPIISPPFQSPAISGR